MKCLIILFLLLSSIIFADGIRPQISDLGEGWYEVTTSVRVENITPKQAEEEAIQRACQLAIEQFAGIEITGRTTLVETESNDKITMEHFSKLSNQVSHGIILEKEIIEKKAELEWFSEEVTVLTQIVRLKVKVGKQPGEADPYFSIDANLNKTYFQEGEELILNVIPSKDCYLTILNIMSDENVSTIFPNNYRKDNFVKANQIFKLPDEKDKSSGIKFKVGLLPDKEEDTEIIKILATKEPVNIQINSDYKTALESLHNWLISIPQDQIVEFDLQYFIYK